MRQQHDGDDGDSEVENGIDNGGLQLQLGDKKEENAKKQKP